jgi:5-(carboxyamino)imidazole ribonucleotide synthase
MILPGATLGVLGGGQLGRMFVAEALRMGYQVVVFDPESYSPAGLIASTHICAAYDDKPALDQFAGLCDAVTIEFENIPLKSLEYIAKKTVLSPQANAVGIAQDRILEKTFFNDHGLSTANFFALSIPEDITAAVERVGFPCILKTNRFGYDGKGQVVCSCEKEVYLAFESLGKVDCILEQMITLEKEVSVVLACSQDGSVSAFPVGENVHKNGILETTRVPASLTKEQNDEAVALTKKLAQSLHYVGVLAIELFISTSGQVLINEIAPRPHNSGHYTQDATDTSQFEQQVRMMCDLPAGSVRLTSDVVMLNLLGDLWGESQPYWEQLFAHPSAYLHLYAKKSARKGRKMGHVNLLGSDVEQQLAQITALKKTLSAA